MDAEERKIVLHAAIERIEKQFGKGAIMNLGEDGRGEKISVIPTGSLTLDEALGTGGIPRGRIIEIYGPESSGKSTLATHIVANAQKQGGLAAYIDAEHALDPIYAQKIGVNTKELMISQPDCGEDALSIAEMLAKANAVDVIVIDSVAALVPRLELEGNIGDTFMGLQARMMSQALRKLTSTLSKTKTCAIFINQIRNKIGVMFGSPETTPGGKALKFYATMRLDIRRIGSIKNNDGIDVGNKVRVKVAKNKLAPPFRIAEFDILFNEGISYEGSLIDLGIERKVIDKKGAWFSFGETRLGQGRESVRLELKKNSELKEKLYQAVMKAGLVPSC